jgi:signal peptidase I
MPARWQKYSYSARIEERRFVISLVMLVLTLVLLFSVIQGFLVTMNSVGSTTMEPTLSPKDRVIATPMYTATGGGEKGFSPFIKAERGDLVLLDPTYSDEKNVLIRVLDSVVSFISFQRFKPFSKDILWGERPSIRRLVGFPGDTLYIQDFVVHVKTAGSSHFLTEFEEAGEPYDITVDALPDNWDSGLPLSGSMDELTLGENEYFVLCDNRITSADSRTWGVIPAARIKGKVLLRYWPFGKAGVP